MPQTEFFEHNVSAFMSNAYESSVNNYVVGPGTYRRIIVDANAPVLPELQTVDPTTGVGSGNELETGHVIVSDYFDTVSFDVGDLLNSDIGGALWHQALGGGIASAAVVGQTGARDHTFGYALDSDARGFNVLTRTFIWKVGGIQYAFAGCGVDEYTMTWEANQLPRFKAKLVGTGYHRPLGSMGDLSLPTLEAQTPFRYLQAVAAALEFTGTKFGGLYNVASSGRFVSLTLTMKNNILLGGQERQPNDVLITDADGAEGAVQGRLRRGVREFTLRLTLRLDNLEREQRAHKSKDILTNFRVAFSGPKIGATTARFGWTAKLPKFRILKVTPDVVNREQVLHLDFKVYMDPATLGHAVGVVRNNLASSLLSSTTAADPEDYVEE